MFCHELTRCCQDGKLHKIFLFIYTFRTICLTLGQLFKSALLSFVHLHHAIAAQNIDGFSCPNRLPTTRTNQLAGAGRPRTCPVCFAKFVAVHQDIGHIIFKYPVNQQFAGGGMRPPIFFRAGNNQAVGFRCLLEGFVVVHAMIGAITDTVLEVQQMTAFMYERCNDFFNGPVQCSRSDVQLHAPLSLHAPCVAQDDMPIGAWGALYGDSNGLQFPIEQVGVNHAVELFKLSQQAGGFGYLFLTMAISAAPQPPPFRLTVW